MNAPLVVSMKRLSSTGSTFGRALLVLACLCVTACGNQETGEKSTRPAVEKGGNGAPKDETGTPGNQDGPSTRKDCIPGRESCEPDGVYRCNAAGTYERISECANCVEQPNPHCPDACAGGAQSVCDNGRVRDCATGQVFSCDNGRCLTDGSRGVCATKPGGSCLTKDASGTKYALLCSDGDTVAKDQVCDLRSGQCKPSNFDCAQLSSVPAGSLACAPSGDFMSACVDGQPQALVCDGETSCSSDGSANCYTAPQAGQACGGSAVCYPGLECTQSGPSTSACVAPAGRLACSKTDTLAVCTDTDTAVACFNGTIWWWRNLTQWGGSCTNNKPVIPEGGNCIPGIADCKQGLACEKSSFDVAGVCRPPKPNAPPECVLTGQVSTGSSCGYQWGSCQNGAAYSVLCQAQRIGSHVVTACSCKVNGVETASFAGAELCGVQSVQQLDSLTTQKCGFPVVTVGVAP